LGQPVRRDVRLVEAGARVLAAHRGEVIKVRVIAGHAVHIPLLAPARPMPGRTKREKMSRVAQ
jgi:hypothetical protein